MFHPEVNRDHQSYPSPSGLLDQLVGLGHLVMVRVLELGSVEMVLELGSSIDAFGEHYLEEMEELVLGSVESVKVNLRLLHRAHT